jgi:predicted DNA-binding transcriptional regulator YafY
LARVLRVLELIQGRGRYAVKDIATTLECSQRTVFRDLAVLELAGVPYFHDRETKSLQVRPGFQFPPVNLTDDEIIGQATAKAITSASGLDITKGAGPTTQKLKVTATEKSAKLLAEVERVTSVLDLKLADHSRHHEMIQTTQWALIQRKRLNGTYASPYEPDSKRLDLHPYRLCLIQQAWYLIDRSEGSEHPQTYRLARFQSLRQIDKPALVPEDFDLKAYLGNAWGVYRGGKTFDVEIVFIKAVAKIVTETFWHHTQTVQRHKDGSVTLCFCVDGLTEIMRWCLSWSGWATVIQPKELRDLVVRELAKALEMNRPDPGGHP